MADTLFEAINNYEDVEADIIKIGNDIAETISEYAKTMSKSGILPQQSEQLKVVFMGECLTEIGFILQKMQKQKAALIDNSLNVSLTQKN